jgi:hypothetical protein
MTQSHLVLDLEYALPSEWKCDAARSIKFVIQPPPQLNEDLELMVKVCTEDGELVEGYENLIQLAPTSRVYFKKRSWESDIFALFHLKFKCASGDQKYTLRFETIVNGVEMIYFTSPFYVKPTEVPRIPLTNKRRRSCIPELNDHDDDDDNIIEEIDGCVEVMQRASSLLENFFHE